MPRVQSRRILYNTDCEGPTVANDNAQEVAIEFLENGGAFFDQLSRFDDYTAYVEKRPQYNAGDTLRLLLPFLKAAGVTDDDYIRFTDERGIDWIEGALDSFDFAHRMKRFIHTYEVSASYRHFALSVATRGRISPTNVYCTDFGLDRFYMTPREAERVIEIKKIIEDSPPFIEIRPGLRPSAYPRKELAILKGISKLVWEDLRGLPCSGQMLRTIRAMGGREKVTAIMDTIRRSNIPPQDTMYIADSITDVEAFLALRELKGVTIAFNGNAHAIDAAEFVVWGDTSLINAILVAVFQEEGRKGLEDFVASPKTRERLLVLPAVQELLSKMKPEHEWGCWDCTPETRPQAVQMSLLYRDRTRKAAAHLS